MEVQSYREFCYTCRQPKVHCYCCYIQKFDPQIKFVILIHPIEVKRRIASGRMSHLCLDNSELIIGHDYSQNKNVNLILNNPNYYPVILYPGQQSTNISPLTTTQRASLFPKNKMLTIFVVDGTWNTARTMVRLSSNLHHLPKICFSPPGPSNFRVRKQPAPGCYSTLEAIHHTIELIGTTQGFNTDVRVHDRLLYVFDKMVSKQLEYVQKAPRVLDRIRIKNAG
ncbi:MAG: tRNA-uridine aminocarboxypropyltransferase [Oligoflexia bacterium]|nr:tRNA-uridine aminocarboxypropyltransferase [Oligoflexia bacterium]